MKELLERVLKELPTYLPDLVGLVSRPKRTIARLIDAAAGDLTRPLVFVAVSVAIGFLLQLPQLGKEQDFATLVASMAVFKVLALIGFAAIIHGCFLAVRGTASFNATFSVYLYLVSPLYIVLVVLEIASLGVLREYDPALAAAARINPSHVFDRPDEFAAFAKAMPGHATAYLVLAVARIALFVGWGIACWGAFRRVHAVPRWRSVIAWLAAFVAFVPFAWSLNYVLLGMFGMTAPALR